MKRLMLLFSLGLLAVMPLAAQEATPDAPPVATAEAALTAPETGDVPPPMPVVDEGGYDIINILLLGATTNSTSNNPGLTDSILIVSINRDTGGVSVVSIPRDYWVYAPDVGMSKINQVYYFGERAAAGTGIDLLKRTILYNLGLTIDFYARVNFDTFAELINTFGGVELTVDCAIQDWVLRSPELDRSDPDSWELTTLNAGRHTVRGDQALWYVRSRRTSSDLDRGRRQQDVMRALYRKIQQEGLLENFPLLWQQLNRLVVTDVTLPDALNLLPVALNTSTADVRYFVFQLQREVNNGYSDDEGRFILIPVREVVAELMQNVVLPPTASQIRRIIPTVAIVNASGVRGMDYVAADRLELEGFRTVVLDEEAPRRGESEVIDYTGLDKSNPVTAIVDVLSIPEDTVQTQPDPQRTYDYKVYLGSQYQFRSCTRPVIPPRPVSQDTPTPAAPADAPPAATEAPAAPGG
ncbi:MAG: LCP family protein [Anaerolineae bacterium]|jgi:LCP family protein required for cell wall assembly|nr:LCP family protein [Anaerolineae bacterium]